MPITLTMPALSPTMEEGVLARWLVGEGDRIAPGDVVAEIETDKATMEYEAPEAGVVARIIVPAGNAAIAVNAPIALLAMEGEDVASVAAGGSPAAPAAAQAGTATPAASPPEAAPADAPAAAPAKPRLAASPLARRLARMHEVDLVALSGSGPHGRIVSRDVEDAVSAAAATTAPAPIAAPASSEPAAAPTADDPYRPGSYEIVELDAMRRTIARRLTESKQTVPHFYLRADIELDAALALRERINAAAPAGGDAGPAWKISVNDMMIKALACALRDVPEANVTWADGRMRRHKPVDVAVAVALDGGLITPVVRDAEKKTLSAISNEMKDLAARARERKLAPEEYQGGTTSLSNLGMFGVSSFDAVINPPHGTILAVGAAERRFVVRGEEDSAVATMMTVTLSVDHRTVDGALGTRLIAALKRLVENPLALLA